MHREPNQPKPTVIVIDDDQYVREALQALFESVGLHAESYSSVQEFREAGSPDRPGCVVLDIRLPGQSGLEYQETLARAGMRRSIVLISGHVDVPMSVRAMKAGAVDVLVKPVHEQELLEAVHRAIEQDAARRTQFKCRSRLEARYASLTDREREIMALVVTGMQNRQVAAAVGLTEATVKMHRGHVMQKMEAASLVHLVRMADLLGHEQPEHSIP